MLRTLGIVQASVGSPAALRKLRRSLGGQSVLGWVVRRVTDAARVDGVIVLVGDSDDHRAILHLVPLDVPIFACPAGDPTERFLRALEKYPAESVVRVQADNFFVDPTLIDRLVCAAESEPCRDAGGAARRGRKARPLGAADSAPRYDYASYASRDGTPAILSSVGIYAEWFRVESLRRAARVVRDPMDRQLVTRPLYADRERFRPLFLQAPEEIDRDDVRLLVEAEEDWDHAETIVEALGPERLEWQRIARLLDHHPELRRRMAALNQTCRAG